MVLLKINDRISCHGRNMTESSFHNICVFKQNQLLEADGISNKSKKQLQGK